jgi:serine/threonine protein kinase
MTQKNNQLFNDKIMKLLKKKNLVEASNLKGKKIISQSQQEIKTKKIYKKNYTTNNSPNNKNNTKSKNKFSNNKDNSFSNKNKHSKNSSSKHQKQKSKIQTKDSNILNNNNISNKKSIKKIINKDNIDEYLDITSREKRFNSKNEIMALKKNLQKNNSENILNNKKIDSNEIDKSRINTISCTSSKTKDSNYYLEKCKSLSRYIKQYYQENQKYPSTNLNFYLYGRLIGQGAFGKVNIGLNILAGRVVAIKSFNKKELDKNGDNMKKILYETDLMKKMNHPNITKILEVFEDEDYILITMEYINGGNLFSFVKKRRKLSEKTAKFLFKQIILGIQHIHSHKIVHRDIKLENILIDLNNNIKICDFGIGKILTYNKQLLYDKCGTPMYMAPEILLSSKNHGYEGYPVDIWSAGISLYIMLSGTLPFNLKNNESSSIEESSENNIELQYSIINNEPKYIEKISDEARDLLKGLLNKNPNKRLTIEQILNHPWLQMDNKGKNKKYHLFAKAEIIMLSKTYIDYRNGNIDDLKENFTLSNLKKDKETKKDKNKIKNISTKSSLLAPYNTLIQEDDSEMDNDFRDCLEDINNPNIVLENDIILIKNKVKEFNLNYELNNNGECDNGMLINTKTGTISSSLNNSSKIEGRLTNRRNEDENLLDELNDENDEQGEEHENKINKILDEIEKLGYDKKYVLNCVNKNILCYASSVFYLMLNYKNI